MEDHPKRTWLRWVITLGGFFLLVVFFLTAERFRGRSNLDDYIAQMRERGERFTIKEITPASAPAEQNGATAFLAAWFPAGGYLNSNLPSFFAMWQTEQPFRSASSIRGGHP